ncbi:HET-domain-containing protein [Xylariaceae sp. AK1471]|nr:HET-domain-containing protein [Xylariaceae sp. AK1471]
MYCDLYKTDSGKGPEDQSSLPSVTDSEPTWSRAKQWLHECMEKDEHSDCRERRMPPRLPIRLICVSKDGRSLRLCLTEDLEDNSSIKYLALSHCWGDFSMPLVATRNNLKSLQTDIPYERLTKSFQDAVTATHRLGFQYIWIDALCILQDDQQDWVVEASRMATVYSGCTLNIVAADAPDGSYGFLDRDERLLKTSIVYKGFEYECSPSIDAYLSRTAVMRRGWCFQETFLSPRSLYFCKSQLYWECCATRADESLPLTPIWKKETTPLRALAVELGHPTTAEDIARQWLRLVIPYSTRAVTLPKDRLVALSGIAHMFDQKADFETKAGVPLSDASYVAGMWRVGLEYQLLWYVPRAERRPGNRSLLAPSWSWASVDGAVGSRLFRSPETGPPNSWSLYDCEIVDCTTNPTTSDRFGEVNGGVLTIWCAVLGKIGPYLDTVRFKAGRSQHEEDFNGKVYLDSSDSPPSELFMVLIGEEYRNVWKDYQVWGLAVEYIKNMGAYRRVGLFRLDPSFRSWKEGNFEAARSRIPITII